MYDDIVASRVEGNISGRDRDFAYEFSEQKSSVFLYLKPRILHGLLGGRTFPTEKKKKERKKNVH